MRMLIPLTLCVAAAGHAAPPAATTAVQRTVVILGRTVGTDVTTVAADGSLSLVFDIVENGRPTRTNARVRLGSDGTIASFDADGRRVLGTRVAESFARRGDHVTWSSDDNRGERDLKGSAFYWPVAELPDAEGLLARALLGAPGGRLALLPAGEARIEKAGEATVAVNGKSRHLTCYSITGITRAPLRPWLDDDGSWFGDVDPWQSVVPAGWESAIAPLMAKKQEIERQYQARLAAAHAHRPPAAGLAYTHARVLDVERGRWLPDHTVIVVGDRIRALGPSAQTPPPAGAEVVDLGGKALLPGLWDMHVHLNDSSGLLSIASGVTSARDLCNDPDSLDAYKRHFDDGSAIGPRVIRYGFIEGRNPKAASSKITAETAAEARAGVAFYAARGYEGIKIYNSVRPELVPLIAKEAHARGMLVTGHVPVHMLAHEAVRAGYDGIEHVNMLFLNFFATHDTDTRDLTRFTLMAEHAPDFDLDGAPLRNFIQLLKQHQTVIDPTLDAFEYLFVGRPGHVIPGLESITARLPLVDQREAVAGGLDTGGDPAKVARHLAAFERGLALIKRLADAGVPLVVGTDWMDGVFLHHELALYVRAGIAPAAALRMATLAAARVMRRDARSGSIAAGKDADLVVVDGDPLARISDIERVVSTMRGGVVFPSAPLYAAVGVKPALLAP